MTYTVAILFGAMFGTIGPLLWSFAVRAGHHVADGSGICERIMWVFPASYLFLGFPQAGLRHPNIFLQAQIVTLVANVLCCSLCAAGLLAAWQYS